jgi:hypothetical protein
MWSAHNFLTLIELGPVNLRDVGQDAVNAGVCVSGGGWLMSLISIARTANTQPQLLRVRLKPDVLCPASCTNHAGAAGFVLLSLTNFVLLIVLGKDVGYEAQHNNPYREAKASGIAFQSSAPV